MFIPALYFSPKSKKDDIMSFCRVSQNSKLKIVCLSIHVRSLPRAVFLAPCDCTHLQQPSLFETLV
jgi:hypothetical protein